MRTAIAALLLMVAAVAEAATVSGTAPLNDSGPACSVGLPMGVNPALKVHVHWWIAGADSSLTTPADSLAVAPGAPFTFTLPLSAGLYRVRGWASDLGGGTCDTTITVAVTKAPPAKVQGFRTP